MTEKKATVKKTATKKAATTKTTTAKRTTTKKVEIAVSAENAGFRAGDVYQALAAAEKPMSVALERRQGEERGIPHHSRLISTSEETITFIL